MARKARKLSLARQARPLGQLIDIATRAGKAELLPVQTRCPTCRLVTRIPAFVCLACTPGTPAARAACQACEGTGLGPRAELALICNLCGSIEPRPRNEDNQTRSAISTAAELRRPAPRNPDLCAALSRDKAPDRPGSQVADLELSEPGHGPEMALPTTN